MLDCLSPSLTAYLMYSQKRLGMWSKPTKDLQNSKDRFSMS